MLPLRCTQLLGLVGGTLLVVLVSLSGKSIGSTILLGWPGGLTGRTGQVESHVFCRPVRKKDDP